MQQPTDPTAAQPMRQLSIPQALQLAERHAAEGRLAVAENIYMQILNKAPSHAQATHGLGVLAAQVGKLPLALKLIASACQLDVSNPNYHRNLGELLRRLGRLDEAATAHAHAIKLMPNLAENHFHFALVLQDQGRLDDAIKAYRHATELNPQYGLAWNNLGACLEKQGNKSGAEEAYLKAITLNPQHAEAQNNLGAIYSEKGKLNESRHCFEAAISAKPDFVDAHYNLSSLKTYTPDDSHLAMLQAVVSSANQLPTHARIRYYFALGKALDDIGQYDKAFEAYAEGNRLEHLQQPNNEANLNRVRDEIPKVFTQSFLKKAPRNNDRRTPVFIVGMPRSGTTLIEQILASHSNVFGAGELGVLHELICNTPGANSDSVFTSWATSMTDEDYKNLGNAYLDKVWQLAPDKQYITDKMPGNFFYIGMIYKALPNAKIINAMRDPMDSCFSCYSRLFNQSMSFAYDQASLGHYYVRYAKLMEYWHSVLPEDFILDLAYEDMVDDYEKQSRRLTEFLGLPWDENCLSFYDNDRLVQTASITQVRKPIYKTSLNRWEHFSQHLQPLMNIVKDYRPKKPQQ